MQHKIDWMILIAEAGQGNVDAVDFRIITSVILDCKFSVRQIAKVAKVSPSTVHSRIKKLRTLLVIDD